jgi:hypothetical protein
VMYSSLVHRSFCCVMYSSAVQQIVLLCDVQQCGTAESSYSLKL